jgi:hypothetical protein
MPVDLHLDIYRSLIRREPLSIRRPVSRVDRNGIVVQYQVGIRLHPQCVNAVLGYQLVAEIQTLAGLQAVGHLWPPSSSTCPDAK